MAGNFNINYSAWSDKKAVDLAKKADTNGIAGLQGKEILIFMKSAKDSGLENKDTFDLMKTSATLDIDYSNWSDKKAIELAKTVDTDGTKGLQGKEVAEFASSSINNEIELTTSKSRAARRSSKTPNPNFDKAVNYYNDKMNSNERYAVTQNTYTKLEERLYKMEHDINQAYVDCEAYSDIAIVPRWHYRYYPRWEDNLISFDIADIRTRTTNDMNSLHELKDKIEYIMEEANGETTHTEPERTPYDIEALAIKHLGMDYETFAKTYKDELDMFKTATYADITSMSSEQRLIYAKAKAYARDMLQTTVNEAHKVNWDAGERKMDETLKASGDMFTISEFEYDGITKEGLSEIKSGIMYKSFEEALIEKHRELDPTGIEELNTNTKLKQPVKVRVNGKTLIMHPNGSIYDEAGRRIK